MAKTRASATDVTLQVGLLSVTGSIYALAKTPVAGGVRLTSVCPTCAEDGSAVPTFTQHTCTHKHGPFAAKDVLKATGTAKNLQVLGSAEEVTDARNEANDGPGKSCALAPYPADMVENTTFPIGTPWVFAVEGKNPAFDLLRDSVKESGRVETDNGDVVLLGEVQLRTDSPAKLVTLRVREGHLLVQEMARPENMNTFDKPADVEVNPKFRKQLAHFLGSEIEDLSADDLKSSSVERFAEFVSERIGDGILALAPPTEEEAQEQNLEAQLAAMLAKAGS